MTFLASHAQAERVLRRKAMGRRLSDLRQRYGRSTARAAASRPDVMGEFR
jgi:hypothetical protein